jgi:hypothetical protein
MTDDQAKNGVTEEFEAFIVAHPRLGVFVDVGSMAQCFL